MSLIFAWYVTSIANYGSISGSLATVIVTLEYLYLYLYLYLSVIVFLSGIQIRCPRPRQRRRRRRPLWRGRQPWRKAAIRRLRIPDSIAEAVQFTGCCSGIRRATAAARRARLDGLCLGLVTSHHGTVVARE